MTRLHRSSLNDPAARRELPRYEGALARAGALAVGRAVLQPGWRWSVDVRPIVGTTWCMLHHVHVLLAGRLGVRLDDGEEATFEPGDVFEIPPSHDAWVVGDEPVELLDISGNIGDFGVPVARSRAIATLLMTDIVGSTDTLARIGDRAWAQRLADHDRVMRAELRRAGGVEIDTTGDGFLAEFASAAAALEAGLRMASAVAAVGVDIRAGVHTGEIERSDAGIRGLAVHATARVMAAAGASELLTTLMTRMLVEPGAFRFTSRGEHSLKGLPAPIELFAVASTDSASDAAPPRPELGRDPGT
jgi:class 3 adenylate cyclase